MADTNKPSKELLIGQRAVYSLSQVSIFNEFTEIPDKGKWVLHCGLHIESKNQDLIPNDTAWYVLVDAPYPLGKIKIFPAKKGGITKTFHHQLYNGTAIDAIEWRDGDICVQTNLIGRRGYDIEPYTPCNRLKWHFERAIEWLKNAANGTLVKNGDMFEIPHYPAAKSLITVGYQETSKSFEIWKKLIGKSGIAEIGFFREPIETCATLSFKSHDNQIIMEPEWGNYVRKSIIEKGIAIWVLFRSPIVLDPWQAPITWAELIIAGKQQDIDIRNLIDSVSKYLRDGKSHLALVGFPVPSRIGEEPLEIHWEALTLPILAHGTIAAKGFRANEQGYGMKDRMVLSGNLPLNWEKTENWHEETITNRGSYNVELTSSTILIVGGGALGSIIADLLARGGVKSLTIVDKDILEVGNLCRHLLSLKDVGKSKAQAIENHLSSVSPNVKIKGISDSIESGTKEIEEKVKEADIIFDCTGNDEALHYFEKFRYEKEKIFCSISIGFKGERIYVFVVKRQNFPRITFEGMMQTWLEKESVEIEKAGQLPREGIGCWHPIFPARIDDISLAASSALKYFEGCFAIKPNEARLAIFQRIEKEGKFCGTELISEQISNT